MGFWGWCARFELNHWIYSLNIVSRLVMAQVGLWEIAEISPSLARWLPHFLKFF
jgi:hypothetical protein